MSTLVDRKPPNPTKDETIPENTQLPEPPPAILVDGGWKAWLQVLGGFLLFFNSWGIVNTFGVYQTFYITDLLSTYSTSSISWIGTFQGFLLINSGLITGPIFDAGYSRTLILIGSFLVVFGMMMISLSTTYWQLFLAQGLCVGLGAGCLFLPGLAIIPLYFKKHRSLAIGITAAGGSVGAVLYPIVFYHLQPRVGFAWATRAIAFLSLGTLCVPILVTRMRVPPAKGRRALIDRTALKSPLFLILSFGFFLAFLGLYVPFFYVIIWAEHILNVDPGQAFYLLSILNAASVFGRILPGLLADKVGALNVLVLVTLVSGIVAYTWLAIKSLAGLIVFCCFYGFLSGAIVSLPATVIAGLVPELRLIGTWMGMSFSIGGVGFLIGNPIDGAILNISENVFNGGLIFNASTVMAGGVAFLIVWVLKARKADTWIL